MHRFAGKSRSLVMACCLIVIAGLSGCRSTRPSSIDARQAFAVGDLATAEAMLTELANGPRKTRRQSQLDLAMVELAAGKPQSAESRLRDLRDHFDSLPKTEALSDAVSLAVDDNQRVFALAQHEQVLIRSMLAICSLANDGQDAAAYCLQAQKKQTELVEKSDTPLVALAPYLHGTLREATLQNFDDAERAFRLVSTIQPSFRPADEDLSRVQSAAHSQPGHGVVYVLAMVGAGPQLIETIAPTTSASLQIASTLIRSANNHANGDDDQPVLPNIASVKVPAIQIPPSDIAAVGVSVTGTLLGATQTLTDVGLLATQQLEVEMPWIIARAIARRAFKEASVASTARTLGLTGNAAAAFEFAAINAWSVTEKADTRCWGLLPREFQVLRAELPTGERTILLQPMSPSGQVFAPPTQVSLSIEDGRNHYVIVTAPHQIISVVTSAGETL